MGPRSTTDSGVKAGGGAAVYETERAVEEYLQFHFASAEELLPYEDAPKSALQFPKRLAHLCSAHVPKEKRSRALDVGCAVGGASFHLSEKFDSVVGIDFSNAFVKAANDMKEKKEMQYRSLIEGEIFETRTASINTEAHPERCTFQQGDACSLEESLGKFDAVLAANLLCRLPDPKLFLDRLPTLLNQGGIVVLVSPFSWLEEYTPKTNWLGGTENGARSTLGLEKLMIDNGFELVSKSDVPFLIREHVRKFQWGCSEGTIWRLCK